jgi:aminopeptidase
VTAGIQPGGIQPGGIQPGGVQPGGVQPGGIRPGGIGPDADAFARLICEWCLQVSPGDQVLVRTTTLAEEPVRALHREILRRRAWPLLRLSPPGLERQFLLEAADDQLDAPAPLEEADARGAHAFLSIQAPADTRELAGLDPERVARLARARSPLQEIRLGKRWTGTLWPTPALAEQAGMSLEAYAAFVERALFLDRDDPVAAWVALRERQARLLERLADAREIRIEAPGTDLRLGVAGRTWINSDGRHNMPSGEVFTGPVEGSAEGTATFTIPSLARGAEVRGVELRFAHGEVVSAEAEVGAEQLRAALQIDRGARFLGEFGIGTNPGIDRATGNTLLDEKIAGTVHLALGRSYPETGGTNASALHWDLVCDLRDGGRVSADGEPVLVDGSPVV